jgi:hypothetical protein
MKWKFFCLFFTFSICANLFVVEKKSVKIDYTDKILDLSGKILNVKNQFDIFNVNLEKELLSLFDVILRDKFKLNEQDSKKLLQELQDIQEEYKKYTKELENRLKSVKKIVK